MNLRQLLVNPTKKIVFTLFLGVLGLQMSAKDITPNPTFFVDSGVSESQILIDLIQPVDDLAAFNLFSHGRSGELLINGTWLNAKKIATFLNSEFNIQNSIFTNLSIYGCEFAKGENGLKAVSYLESALGLKVNASTNITGKDGDWVLEVGNKNTAIKINNYPYNLQVSCDGTGVVGGTKSQDDYDGDGVCNVEDQDDDNDGILDEDECAESRTDSIGKMRALLMQV